MANPLFRSLLIFRLALSFFGDYGRVRWIERRLDGVQKEAAVARVYARSGARLRRAALHLQGLIVKVGQFLSARTDVLPIAFTRELTQLQDAVPGVPFSRVKPAIEHELGAELDAIFAQLDEEPIAAASLGQVHKARLRDGQVVAVKILRPGIERLSAIDLVALRKVIWFMHHHTRFGRRMNIQGLYEEFRAMVDQELDYRIEAENLRRFQRNFAANPNLVIPRLHDAFVSRRILVMEFIEGAKVTDLAQFTAWGVDPSHVAEILLDAYLQQILVDGFVHVDPHPGNLLILPDRRVCFLDFGMMSEVASTDVRTFSRMVTAALAHNLDGVVQAIDQLGFLQPHANRDFLKRAISFMLDLIGGLQLTRNQEFTEFLTLFQNFLHEEPIIIQARYMFLGRAIAIASGVITGLQPNINWMQVLKDRALPLLSAHMEQDGSRQTAWRRPIRDLFRTLLGETGAATADIVLDQIQESVLTAIRAPATFERVLNRADRGDLTIRLELQEVLSLLERQERLLVRGIWSLLAGISGGVGLWLLHGNAGVSFAARIAFASSGLFLLLIIMNALNLRRRRR